MSRVYGQNVQMVEWYSIVRADFSPATFENANKMRYIVQFE